MKALRVLLFLSSVFALRASAEDGCSLSRFVNSFDAPRQSRLASLRDFARQNRLSFGIESSSSLDEQTAITASAGPVLSVVKTILGPTSTVSLRCIGRVILIRDQAPSPSWLDTRVPDFRLKRSHLGMADAALWMRVELVLNPAQQGFVGDMLGDLGEEVGPFYARHVTVRTLLSRLVASSPGSLWISGDIQPFVGTSWSNRLWTLVPYEREPR